MAEFLFFSERTTVTFRAAASRIVAPKLESDDATSDEVVRVADRMLAARPEGDRKKLALFLLVLEWLPLFRYGRRFSALRPEQRDRVLAFFERAPFSAKLRQGFFGIKTFALMGYYGSERSFAELGYPGPRPDAPSRRLLAEDHE